ncbi:MAG: hypothetical protein ACTHNW_20810 [Mucilaginibacter sp.]
MVRDGDWKLRRTKTANGDTLLELFNLGWDPAERVNQANDHKEQVDRLLPILNNFVKETSKPYN